MTDPYAPFSPPSQIPNTVVIPAVIPPDYLADDMTTSPYPETRSTNDFVERVAAPPIPTTIASPNSRAAAPVSSPPVMSPRMVTPNPSFSPTMAHVPEHNTVTTNERQIVPAWVGQMPRQGGPPNLKKMKQHRKENTVVAGVTAGFVGLVVAGPVGGVVSGVSAAVLTKQIGKRQERKVLKKYQNAIDAKASIGPPIKANDGIMT